MAARKAEFTPVAASRAMSGQVVLPSAKSQQRVCSNHFCSYNLARNDPHVRCALCLGFEHAQQAFSKPGLCPCCLHLTVRQKVRRLNRVRASLDLPDDIEEPESEDDLDYEAAASASPTVPEPCQSLAPSGGRPIPRLESTATRTPQAYSYDTAPVAGYGDYSGAPVNRQLPLPAKRLDIASYAGPHAMTLWPAERQAPTTYDDFHDVALPHPATQSYLNVAPPHPVRYCEPAASYAAATAARAEGADSHAREASPTPGGRCHKGKKLLKKLCSCGYTIHRKDPHSACPRCLGLEHAQDALESGVVECVHCAVIPKKILKRRLAQQTELFNVSKLSMDSLLGIAGALQDELLLLDAMESEQAESTDPKEQNTSTPTRKQVHTKRPKNHHQIPKEKKNTSPNPKEQTVQKEEGKMASSSNLATEGDDSHVSTLDLDVEAFLPVCIAFNLTTDVTRDLSTLDLDMQGICKRAAVRLDMQWPTVQMDTGDFDIDSDEAGKPRLPCFPELLEELTVTWQDKPYSKKQPFMESSLLQCDGMESHGLLQMPPVEPLVAAHLYSQTSPSAYPSETDRLQASLNDECYKTSALTVRALNASSILMAYQAELEKDMAIKPDALQWADICLISHHVRRLHKVAIQAAGRAMGLAVLQERARWLNRTNLMPNEKEELLDIPIVQSGLFGASDDAMKLCLRTIPAGPCSSYTQATQIDIYRDVESPSSDSMAYRRDRRPIREPYDDQPLSSSQREVTYQRVVNVVERRTTTNRLDVAYDRGYDDDDQRYYNSRNMPDSRGYRGESAYPQDVHGYTDLKQYPITRPIPQLEDSPYRDDVLMRRQVEISRTGRDRGPPYGSSRGPGLNPLLMARVDRGGHPHPARGDDYDDDYHWREPLNTSRDRSPPRREVQTSGPAARSAGSSTRSYTPDREAGFTYQQLQQRQNPRVPTSHPPSGSAAASPRSSAAVQEELPASVKEPEDDVMVVGSTEPKLTPKEDLKARRAKAITAKAFEIEKLYRQDCETFGTVVKMLANKEPALEQMLMAPLKENLLEIKQRCLDDLSHFIKELDQAMELDQAAQPSEVISV